MLQDEQRPAPPAVPEGSAAPLPPFSSLSLPSFPLPSRSTPGPVGGSGPISRALGEGLCRIGG